MTMYNQEQCWINPRKLPFEATKAVCELVVSDEDIADAEARLERFASFIRSAFPETECTGGLIESPLRAIPQMQTALEKEYRCRIPGTLLLKMDSHLAIAGSVKARGGIYEVLKHAETLAITHGKITVNDDYRIFDTDEMRAFLSQFTVQVGSTGNLGMSIGIMSAALGFRVKVHMSADAKQWKKDLLRSHGVQVIEYENDYSAAVAAGRTASATDPASHFVDDERSVDLFVGYATAARRLQKQLREAAITVDAEHPLFVYVPAGIGGAPGGISYGLKRIFGDAVHCFFTETVTCPSVLIGLDTQTFERANVREYGISGQTHADGLACPSPSGFVTRLMTPLLSGEMTVTDAKLYDYLRLLDRTENVRIEPSSCAAFAGPCGLLSYPSGVQYCTDHGITEDRLQNATHIAWATGGRMIPADSYEDYLNTYL